MKHKNPQNKCKLTQKQRNTIKQARNESDMGGTKVNLERQEVKSQKQEERQGLQNKTGNS